MDQTTYLHVLVMVDCDLLMTDSSEQDKQQAAKKDWTTKVLGKPKAVVSIQATGGIEGPLDAKSAEIIRLCNKIDRMKAQSAYVKKIIAALKEMAGPDAENEFERLQAGAPVKWLM
jgi:hypothetical protein